MNFFRLKEFAFLERIIPQFGAFQGKIYGFYLWLFILGAFFVVLNFKNSSEIKFKPTVGRAMTTTIFLVWSIMSLAGISIFLYFNF